MEFNSRLKSYGDINAIHGTGFEPRDFNDFELDIFNNNGEFDGDMYNVNNSEIIYSLINYCDVSKNDEDYLMYTQKLIDLNDPRGFLKMGVHYHKKKDYIEAAKWFEKGSDMNEIHSTINLGSYYLQEDRLGIDCDKSFKYLTKACSSGLKGMKLTIIHFVKLYLFKKDIVNGFKYLVAGIKNSDEGCYKVLKTFVGGDELNIYSILSSLSFSNELTKKKMEEIKLKFSEDEINENDKKKFIFNDFDNYMKNYYELKNDEFVLCYISDKEKASIESDDLL